MLLSHCSLSAFAKVQTIRDSGQITTDTGGLCEHHTEHNGDCRPEETESSVSGNNAAPSNAEGTPCGFVCEICSAEDVAPSDEATMTVEQVQGLIDALPAAEELIGMSKDKQNEVYNALQAAYDAYESLTGEQKEEITGADIFESLFAFFNGMVNPLEAQKVSIADSSVTITANTCPPDCPGHIITGESPRNAIKVESGTHNITLQSVNIDISNQSGTAAFSIEGSAKVNLTLVGDNTLESGWSCAGLQVPDGAELVIMESSTGSLNAAGGEEGAGIGGGKNSAGGKITINGGTVNANGGDGAGGGAGIGGGKEGAGGTITISGGTVNATSRYGGAGIGGGKNGAGGKITINGGTVNANGGDGAGGGAGIGGGKEGAGGTITISGGTVNATSRYGGAGIGGGKNGAGGKITINGGTVIANGGAYGAGIGGGYGGYGDTITINGGNVTATGGEYGAGIGSGDNGDGGTIAINGGTVNATSGFKGAGIGGGYDGDGDIITINGGTVNATSNGKGAGIGGGEYDAGGTITIEGGTVTVTSNEGAGIGSGSGFPGGGGIITINGGTVDATSSNGAGIGGGLGGANGTFAADGNAFIIASSISDNSDTDDWSGVIFVGDAGQVYNSPVKLTTDAEIPSGKELTIGNGQTLTVGAGVTLTNKGTITNNGTINVEPGGKLVGDVTGSGTINYAVTVPPEDSGGGGSSSNSSGSGGGSMAAERPRPALPTTSRTKPVKPDANGSVVVDNDAVEAAISAAKDSAKKNGNIANGVAVVIPIIPEAGQTSFSVTVKVRTLNLLVRENVKRLEINMEGVVVETMDAGLLAFLNTLPPDGDLVFRVKRTDQAGLSKKAKAAVGTRPLCDLSLVYLSGGKETPVTGLGGHTLSVRLPYTPAKEEQAGSLYAVYVDEKDRVEWLTKSAYDPDLGAVIFETGHFSIYGIGYKNPAPTFTDIENHWAADNIIFVASRGLLSGTGNNQFSPDAGITRGMFVTALGRLAGVNPADYKTGIFADVNPDAEYAPYVNWAAEKGIVNGIAAAAFSPDANITREQMAVIMADYAKKLGYELPAVHEAVTFADNAQISAQAAKEVKAMQQAGIMAGKDGSRFDPKGSTTRAEAATILRRFVETVIDPQSVQGWVQNHSGSWQYMKNGKPAAGWLDDNGKRYWLDEKGRMFNSGWKQIDSTWYYFYPDGSIAVNTTIDGYTIGTDGARK